MATIHKSNGPWTHRLLVYSFTAAFALLVYWLLNFVVRDIATWPGPDYEHVEKSILDQDLVAKLASLRSQIDEVNRAIASRKQRQAVLRDSTSNSEKTMNQLLELQKLTLQKGVAPAPEAATALAESQKLFLTNQAKYQEMNDQVATLTDQLGDLERQQREAQKTLEVKRPAVQAQFDRLQSRHQLKLAALKLAVLLPLLAVAVWLFLKKRATLYAPLIYGFGLAILLKVALVMHEHFPSRYFKYILILVALALVTRILVYLLRSMAFPKLDWLLKQYREAYEHFFCPVCSYPIRRGPLKSLFWTRSSLKKLNVPSADGVPSEELYVCPVCATRLFEECPNCKKVRHSLLPACVHCGVEKPLPSKGQPAATPSGAAK
jgi:hypothetical protein